MNLITEKLLDPEKLFVNTNFHSIIKIKFAVDSCVIKFYAMGLISNHATIRVYINYTNYKNKVITHIYLRFRRKYVIRVTNIYKIFKISIARTIFIIPIF